jgi:LytS/YehU family sensor histidine kinase
MITLPTILTTLNAFVEDTCVIVVVAYLMTRGHLLALLSERRPPVREQLLLGGLLGLIALTEDIFPGARYPYVTRTLIITFTTLAAGAPAGTAAALVAAVGSVLLRGTSIAAGTIPTIVASVGIALLFRRRGYATRLSGAFTAGMTTQAVSLALAVAEARLSHRPFALLHAAFSIPANGIGVLLLQTIVRNAAERTESQRRLLDAERTRAELEKMHTLVVETQLGTLRAQMHPHFLFNTLSTIAALCRIAPKQAEKAIIRLGELMHRVLDEDSQRPIPLEQELSDLHGYLEIQGYRLGNRLCLQWQTDEAICRLVRVPRFALLTLLENALSHGISEKDGEGTVRIIVRRSRVGPLPRALIAVRDDGVGMDTALRRALADALRAGRTPGRMHGLTLLDQQLRLQFGPAARLRIRSHPHYGTLVALVVPLIPKESTA